MSIVASKDNTIYESSTGGSSNGAGTSIFAGNNNAGTTRRALVGFDVAGSVPAGSRIVSATLQLQMTRTTGGAAAIRVHRVLADWGEGASDAGGNEGGGAGAAPGDATWVHTFFDTGRWSTPGGDFVEDASAVTPVAGVGVYKWGSTAEMVADVQGWLDNPASSFGWIVIGDESTGRTAKRFASVQSSAAAARPVLIVEFVPG